MEKSAHDFSQLGWHGDGCVVCHTNQSSESKQQTQQWFESSVSKRFSAFTANLVDTSRSGQPKGGSRFCLSCHDGTIAQDSYASKSVARYQTQATPDHVRENLSADHPISIPYQLSDRGKSGSLYSENRRVFVGKQSDKFRTDTLKKLLLKQGTVQCDSCHDVHNNFTIGETLLKQDFSSSEICYSCHAQFHLSSSQLQAFHEEKSNQLLSNLKKGKIQCHHCHDIHYQSAASLQRKIDVGSQICLKCHKRRSAKTNAD